MVILDSVNDPKLIELIARGAVGVLPTDTLYGIVCSATDKQAVKRLYALKKRDKKPGTVIAANIDQLVNLGLKARYLKAVAHFWPNPISIEIPLGPNLTYLHQGMFREAFRLPIGANIRTLLTKTGPLLTSSANQPGEPHSNTLAEAQAYFGDTVDFYVDGGDLSGQKPSTIIRIIDDAIDVVRQGAVKINDKGEIEQ